MSIPSPLGIRSRAAITRVATPASAGTKTRREPEMDTALNVTTLASRRRNDFVASKPRIKPVIGPDGALYRPHPNGGGLVATTARVEASVFVGPHALVQGNAEVSGSSRLLDRAIVSGNATVSGRCTLRHDARIEGNARIDGGVVLMNHAIVTGRAILLGKVRVEYYAVIDRRCRIEGDLLVS